MIGGDVRFHVEIYRILTHPPPLQNADFPSIFPRSASAVTHSKKVQLTLIGSPLALYNEPNMNIGRPFSV